MVLASGGGDGGPGAFKVDRSRALNRVPVNLLHRHTRRVMEDPESWAEREASINTAVAQEEREEQSRGGLPPGSLLLKSPYSAAFRYKSEGRRDTSTKRAVTEHYRSLLAEQRSTLDTRPASSSGMGKNQRDSFSDHGGSSRRPWTAGETVYGNARSRSASQSSSKAKKPPALLSKYKASIVPKGMKRPSRNVTSTDAFSHVPFGGESAYSPSLIHQGVQLDRDGKSMFGQTPSGRPPQMDAWQSGGGYQQPYDPASPPYFQVPTNSEDGPMPRDDQELPPSLYQRERELQQQARHETASQDSRAYDHMSTSQRSSVYDHTGSIHTANGSAFSRSHRSNSGTSDSNASFRRSKSGDGSSEHPESFVDEQEQSTGQGHDGDAYSAAGRSQTENSTLSQAENSARSQAGNSVRSQAGTSTEFGTENWDTPSNTHDGSRHQSFSDLQSDQFHTADRDGSVAFGDVNQDYSGEGRNSFEHQSDVVEDDSDSEEGAANNQAEEDNIEDDGEGEGEGDEDGPNQTDSEALSSKYITMISQLTEELGKAQERIQILEDEAEAETNDLENELEDLDKANLDLRGRTVALQRQVMNLTSERQELLEVQQEMNDNYETLSQKYNKVAQVASILQKKCNILERKAKTLETKASETRSLLPSEAPSTLEDALLRVVELEDLNRALRANIASMSSSKG